MFSLFVSLQSIFLPLSSRASYETPDYNVVRSEEPFEIRDYPALTIVSAPMPHRGSDGAFMKLFRFISGKNDRSEEISMTTPVLMSGTESGSMSFIVPKAVAAKGVPIPSNPELKISSMSAGRFAVVRFKGSTSPKLSKEMAAKLSDWVLAQGILTDGPPVFAYYNPPWTPGFMRRNEVLIRLHSDK